MTLKPRSLASVGIQAGGIRSTKLDYLLGVRHRAMEMGNPQPSRRGACGLSGETARAGPGLPLWEAANTIGLCLATWLLPHLLCSLKYREVLKCQDLSFFTCKMGLITASNPVEMAEIRQVIIQVLGHPQERASLARWSGKPPWRSGIQAESEARDTH